jgi:Predicted membrane protein
MRVASWGHAFFAATLIGLGCVGLIQGDFTPTLSGVPKEMPAREILVYLCAVVCLATGIGLLWQRTAAVASRILLIYLLLWLLLFRVYRIFVAPAEVVTWWAWGDTAVMTAAAWVLYVWLAGGSGLRIARVLYGLALIPFGIAHFIYLKQTVAVVPGWLPWHVAVAYVTGGALIAAGVAVAIDVYARLGAVLSAVLMGLFTLLVWVPIVATGPTAFQWAEFVDSWTLTAGAWVVAESYKVGQQRDFSRQDRQERQEEFGV